MELTQLSEYKNRQASGYMLNVALSQSNQKIISLLVEQIKTKFPDLILEQPGDALHITLMDWVAPLVTYEKSHDSMFEEVFSRYDDVLSAQLENIDPFDITFDSIHVSPAAIFIQGHDKGQFQRIRDGFIERVQLLPGTKQPPQIVHCTIARFDKEIELAPIESFIEPLEINFTQHVEAFRLVHEIEMPMLSYEVIKSYTL